MPKQKGCDTCAKCRNEGGMTLVCSVNNAVVMMSGKMTVNWYYCEGKFWVKMKKGGGAG